MTAIVAGLFAAAVLAMFWTAFRRSRVDAHAREHARRRTAEERLQAHADRAARRARLGLDEDDRS